MRPKGRPEEVSTAGIYAGFPRRVHSGGDGIPEAGVRGAIFAAPCALRIHIRRRHRHLLLAAQGRLQAEPAAQRGGTVHV